MTHIESRSTPHIDVADRWHRLTPHSDATASRFIYLDSSRLLVSFNDIPTARRIRLITDAASFGVSRRTVTNHYHTVTFLSTRNRPGASAVTPPGGETA